MVEKAAGGRAPVRHAVAYSFQSGMGRAVVTGKTDLGVRPLGPRLQAVMLRPSPAMAAFGPRSSRRALIARSRRIRRQLAMIYYLVRLRLAVRLVLMGQLGQKRSDSIAAVSLLKLGATAITLSALLFGLRRTRRQARPLRSQAARGPLAGASAERTMDYRSSLRRSIRRSSAHPQLLHARRRWRAHRRSIRALQASRA
jgi:hypothetical protein